MNTKHKAQVILISSMASASTKALLRKQILSTVASLSVEERARQSDIIQMELLASNFFKTARHISVYLSLPKEVCTDKIVQTILEDSTKVLYVPDIIQGGEIAEMKMLQVHSETDLSHFEKKQLNVLCPTHDIVRKDPLSCDGEGLDLIVLPGIAFDKTGARMGRGKGYYDRYIDKVKKFHDSIGKPMPYLVALGFDEQVFPEIPMSPTDRHMDKILYPQGIQGAHQHSL